MLCLGLVIGAAGSPLPTQAAVHLVTSKHTLHEAQKSLCTPLLLACFFDRKAPSVSIVSPTKGAKLSGAIVMSGSASDNQAVVSVQILMDGSVKELADGTKSWVAALDTTLLPDGHHTLTAQATDLAGNVGSAKVGVDVKNGILPSPSPDPSPPPSPSPSPSPSPTSSPGPYPIKGVYERDSSPTGFDYEKSLGFNFIDTGPYKDAVDALDANGIRGFIWLGGYNNTTCTFNESDTWVESHMSAIAGNPGVGAYFIDDEPDAQACPTAPAQIHARSELVKSIDPSKPTFIVIYRQFADWVGTVDIIGLDFYPCSYSDGCVYSKIDDKVAQAEAAGITRYWGVIQAHGDDWYRQPTPDEEHQIFQHWRATRMQGYLVFSWEWPPDNPDMWLANNLPLRAQLQIENSS